MITMPSGGQDAGGLFPTSTAAAHAAACATAFFEDRHTIACRLQGSGTAKAGNSGADDGDVFLVSGADDGDVVLNSRLRCYRHIVVFAKRTTLS